MKVFEINGKFNYQMEVVENYLKLSFTNSSFWNLMETLNPTKIIYVFKKAQKISVI